MDNSLPKPTIDFHFQVGDLVDCLFYCGPNDYTMLRRGKILEIYAEEALVEFPKLNNRLFGQAVLRYERLTRVTFLGTFAD